MHRPTGSGLLVGSLDGPSKTITVEPVVVPVTAPAPPADTPDFPPECPEPAPERPPAPAR